MTDQPTACPKCASADLSWSAGEQWTGRPFAVGGEKVSAAVLRCAACGGNVQVLPISEIVERLNAARR